jgi:hypothetical protein
VQLLGSDMAVAGIEQQLRQGHALAGRPQARGAKPLDDRREGARFVHAGKYCMFSGNLELNFITIRNYAVGEL